MSDTEKSQPETITDAIVVLCTAPDEACAQQLASLALSENWPPASHCYPAHPPCITGKENWNRNMKSR